MSLSVSSLKELYCESNIGRKILLFLLVVLSCTSLYYIWFYNHCKWNHTVAAIKKKKKSAICLWFGKSAHFPQTVTAYIWICTPKQLLQSRTLQKQAGKTGIIPHTGSFLWHVPANILICFVLEESCAKAPNLLHRQLFVLPPQWRILVLTMSRYCVLAVLWEDLLVQFISQICLSNVNIEQLFYQNLKITQMWKSTPQAAREISWESRNFVIFA